MKRRLRIDVLDGDFNRMIREEPRPPEGISLIGPLGITLSYGQATTHVFFLVTAPSDFASDELSNWVYRYFKDNRAKRLFINNRVPKDQEEFGEIFSQEIHLGQSSSLADTQIAATPV